MTEKEVKRRQLPRVLFLSMEAPRMPGSGGQVRSAAIALALTQIADVTLVSLGGPGGGGGVGGALSSACGEVIECGPLGSGGERASRLRSWKRTLTALFLPWRHGWNEFLRLCMQYGGRVSKTERASWPWTRRVLAGILRLEYRLAARFFSLPPLTVFLFRRNFAAVRRKVSEILHNKRIDIIWYEHSLMYPFAADLLTEAPGARLICNAHNVEALLHSRIASMAESASDRANASIQQRLLARLETKAFRNSAMVIACSGEDLKAIRATAPDTTCTVIGNGVDTLYFQRPEGAQRASIPTVVFTGGFGYGPNIEGLAWFTREILPLIHEQCPDCRFVFAGAVADAAAKELALSDARISWISSPEDIRPSFYEAWLAVVPLRSGGGTRLKILEAMAMECAVVSTSIGAEGIPCVDGEHLLKADSPKEFAGAVVRLLNDAELRARMERRAANWVRTHFDWGILGAQLHQAMHEAFPDFFPGTSGSSRGLNTETNAANDGGSVLSTVSASSA